MTNVFPSLAGCRCDRDSVTSERAPKPKFGAPLTQATPRRDDPRGPSDDDPEGVPRPFGTPGVRLPAAGLDMSGAAESGPRFPRQVGGTGGLVLG